MAFVAVLLLGVVGGGICVFVLLETKRRSLDAQKHQQAEEADRLAEEARASGVQRHALDENTSRFERTRAEFDKQAISYNELRAENKILKRDLQNVDVNLRKLQLDVEAQSQKQRGLDERSRELASKYLQDNIRWIGSTLNPSNFSASKQKLQNVVARCREIGFVVSEDEEARFVADLKQEYERVVRSAFEREEQARIKAQIREEQQLQKEIDRELKQLDRERAAIQAALDQALAKAKDEHSTEVDYLRARLAEAEAKTQRAMSQAQMTKAGHVYVISNIGSFGSDVFKIGMTRRLEPLERVRELGRASVPFPYDVHMMISCDDAPSLENELHRTLHKLRLNKCNPRKEFFKVDIDSIKKIVEEKRGEVDYVADPEALQYRQSLTMTDEDQEYIESVYDELEDEEGEEAVISED